MQGATQIFPQVYILPDLQTSARCPQGIRNTPVSDCRSCRVSWTIVKRNASWSGLTSTFRRNQQQISQPEQKKKGRENWLGAGLELSDGVYCQSGLISRTCPSFAHVRRRCSRSAIKNRICAERSSRSKFFSGRNRYSCIKKGFNVAETRTQRQRWKGITTASSSNLQCCHEVAGSSFEIRDHPLSGIKCSTNGHKLQTSVKTSGGAKSCETKPAPGVSRFTAPIHEKRSLQHTCSCCLSSDDHNETKLPDAVVVEDISVDNVGVQVALALLRFYKRELSPYIPASCRYVPTCSEYAQQAYKKYGFAKGSILTAWRLARCNPLGSSGFDPPRWFGEEKPPQL
ncbi:hypothetical protein Mapa_011669 [Marchantia paleacea]|nr:hypothetical protein Mapa_011669 [Marchantia paleacea]